MAVLIPFIFNLQFNQITLIMALFGYMAFYASTWEEYHTGVLYLGYLSGPVEGAWSVVLCSLVSFFDLKVWDTKIAMGLDLKDVVPIIFILGSIFTVITSIKHSYHCKKDTLISLLKQWIPIVLYFCSCFLLTFLIPISLSKWFIFLTGLPACFRISSTIIAYVTKSPLRTCSFYPLEFIPSSIFALYFILNFDLWMIVFKVAVLISFLVYLSTMLRIIYDICSHLDIYCLSIKKKKKNRS
jgi:hypothetical protein